MSNVIYATSGYGLFRKYIGWFNFTDINVIPGNGQKIFMNTIPNKGTITAELVNQGVPSITTEYWIEPLPAAYSGVGESATSNMSLGSAGTTLAFGKIVVVDTISNPITEKYSIIVADPGASTNTEGLIWTSNKIWHQFETLPVPFPASPASRPTGNGTNTLRTIGNGVNGSVNYTSPVAGIYEGTDFTIGFIAGWDWSAVGILFDSIPCTKFVDKNFAQPGDTITYSIEFTNVSILELTETSIIDTLPVGVTYIDNTFKVNNITLANVVFPNIFLGTIPVGQVTTVTFKVKIDEGSTTVFKNSSMIYGNRDGKPTEVSKTNIVTTTILSANIINSKKVDKQKSALGDVLTYTINLFNDGTTIANNIILFDTIPEGTSYVSNSLIGGIGNLNTGITIPNLEPNKMATVIFQVLITTIPINYEVINSSTSTYTFNSNPVSIVNISKSSNSNIVSTSLGRANLEIIKSVDKFFATYLDVLTYTLIIQNTGNIVATNIIFKDTLPNNTMLVNNSVVVNGNVIPNADITAGFSIPNIEPNGISTISFQVYIK